MQLTPLWPFEHLRLEKTHSNDQIGVFYAWDFFMNDERSHTFEFFQCFIGLCYGMILQLECETPLNVVLGTVESQSTAMPCPHRSLYLGLLLAPPFFFPWGKLKVGTKKGKRNSLPFFLSSKDALYPKANTHVHLRYFWSCKKGVQISKVRIGRNQAT